MTNHEIDEMHKVSENEIRQLPDRSNLSKLYFSTNKGYQKGSVNFENTSNESSHTQYVKKLNKCFIPIGFMLPIPFVVAIVAFDFFSSIVNSGNVMFLLPLMALSGILIAGGTVIIYKKIREMLKDSGIAFWQFLIYMLLCLSVIYAPVSFICFHITNSMAYHAIAYVSISVIASIIGWLYLKGTGDDHIPKKIRTSMIMMPVFICLLTAIIFNFYFTIK